MTDTPSLLHLLRSTKVGDQKLVDTIEAPSQAWLEILTAYPGLAPSVARNRRLPSEVAIYLAQNSDPFVRAWIALHRLTPTLVLETLATDPALVVRYALARAPAATPAILERLTRDPWKPISVLASKRLRTLASIRKHSATP